MIQKKNYRSIKRTLAVLLLAAVVFAGYTAIFSDSAVAEGYLGESLETAQDNEPEENRKWNIPTLIGMLLIYVAAAATWFAVCQLAGYYWIDVQTGLLGNIDGLQVQIDRDLERMERNSYQDENIGRY